LHPSQEAAALPKLKTLLLLTLLIAPSCLAAAPGAITIATPTAAVTLTPAQIATLPAIKEHVSFGTDHGPMTADFAGPLLWSVLNQAHPIPMKSAVRGAVIVTGADGYTALIALGELAPAFEDKKIILATTMNAKPLAPGHFRIVVPGDAKGGRCVYDVIKLTELLQPPPPK
jgi:hypothetical protein